MPDTQNLSENGLIGIAFPLNQWDPDNSLHYLGVGMTDGSKSTEGPLFKQQKIKMFSPSSLLL